MDDDDDVIVAAAAYDEEYHGMAVGLRHHGCSVPADDVDSAFFFSSAAVSSSGR